MSLKKKIDSKSAKIGVIGLGYVGLPLSIEFAVEGFKVIGIDNDEEKVDLINSKKCYISDVSEDLLSFHVEKGSFKATTDFSNVKNIDSLFICVPTPLNKQKDPDISYIISVMEEIKAHVHDDMMIVLESTTYPGSTRELILPYLERLNYKIGKNIFLCFSPERIDPGNEIYNSKNTPKIIGGITADCTKHGKNLYNKIIDKVIEVSSTETAEMTKLLENTFRAINIGLVNEIAIMCEKLNINVWEVIDAASTKPFGYMKFEPGPGLGGHCIPIDPHYLSWKLKILDYEARFIRLAGEINTNMPNHILSLISSNLNKLNKPLNNSNILIIGVAYKRNISDIRESPAIDVIRLLKNSGSLVQYYDPYVPAINISGNEMTSLTEINKSKIDCFDACVIITNHSNIDYELIHSHSNLIIDTRNVYNNIQSSHIKRLGQG